MTADLQDQAYVNEAVLYMALELSNAKWRLAFGDGTRQRHAGSERWVWRVVRVPDAAREDLRQLHREREDLLTERTRHRNRLSSKLVAQGIRFPIGKDFLAHLEAVMLFDGSGLPAHLKAWVLVMELFGWRALTNRRQLASLAGWSHRRTTGAA